MASSESQVENQNVSAVESKEIAEEVKGLERELAFVEQNLITAKEQALRPGAGLYEAQMLASWSEKRKQLAADLERLTGKPIVLAKLNEKKETPVLEVQPEVTPEVKEKSPEEAVSKTATEAAAVFSEVAGVPVSAEMQDYIAATLGGNPEVASAMAVGLEEVKVKEWKAAELSEKFTKAAEAVLAKAPERSRLERARAAVGRFLGGLGRRLPVIGARRSIESKGVRVEAKSSPVAQAEVTPETAVPAVQSEVASVAERAIEAAENIGSPAQAEALQATVNAAFDARRSEVVAAGEEVRLVHQEMVKRAQEKLRGLMQGSNLEELQRAHAYFEKLNDRNALEGFTLGDKAMSPEEIKLHINYLAAATINTEMDARIEAVFEAPDSTLRSSGYRELSAVLKPYLATEQLGSKKGLEVKVFFSKILKAKLREIQAEKGNETKVALLENFIKKNGLA